MRQTPRCCASTAGRRPRFKASWLSPGLTSHQQLDAGIAARQHAGRKALRNSKRPFDTYFRTQYRISPRLQQPMTRTDGIISSRDAVRMMTDPSLSWTTPWGRPDRGVRVRRKRHDVIHHSNTRFGEDSSDGLLVRLMELRYAWDREDDILALTAVPTSLHHLTEHCRPHARAEKLFSPCSTSTGTSLSLLAPSHAEEDDTDGEIVMIGHCAVRVRRRTPTSPKMKSASEPNERRHEMGFSGVETIPSLALDVSHGPLLTSLSQPTLTLRWKAEHRDSASVQDVLQLRRRFNSASTIGLPPRSALLLLKATASVEMEDPAQDVALAIAMGENYHGYYYTECIELLRCLRRLAMVRGIAHCTASGFNGISCTSSSTGSSLYTDASLSDAFLANFIRDTAPFLSTKVWSRLPEHSRHLLSARLYLDWFDLLSIAVAMSGPQQLPSRLPNPASEAPYAAKYLFLRYSLELNDETMKRMARAMRDIGLDETVSSMERTEQLGLCGAGTGLEKPSSERKAEVTVDHSLVLWMCASLLIRVVAEALGDVVRHVGDSLHQQAAIASEQAEQHLRHGRPEVNGTVLGFTSRYGPVTKGGPTTTATDELARYLDELQLHRPYGCFSSGCYQQMGRRRPRKVRVRLLPFEAFPRVSHCFSCPFAAATEKAEASERHRRQRFGGNCALQLNNGACQEEEDRGLESPFSRLVATSPLVQKHMERATAALQWSTMVLQQCHYMIRGLSAPPPIPALEHQRRQRAQSSDGHLRLNGERSSTSAATVAERRHALCYYHVRSKVQMQMDCLFSYIPWGVMEEQWEPILRGSSETTGEEVSLTPDDVSTALEWTPAALEESLMEELCEDGGDARKEDHQLTKAEQQTREMVEALREQLEQFQVAVADMLEAHERFFQHDSPSASPPTVTTTPYSVDAARHRHRHL